ncbi:ribosomal protein S18-alanine N-acetyltransferase [Methanolobus halotolerans]|uniref:Ribosomal-protein-alanine N-acetyltransferase n=1 Tax=Methanolobus halotolerans TaxID=2052935 RepID=A0A4E0QQ74_9EURY|nr:ribosomal protein S18-alanine N-acetyltransferase [Methanolobus halotolerans]TGC07225.1 ribosomal-protein-alanine N-acetyltransferase [Methanolobus halotolerans]
MIVRYFEPHDFEEVMQIESEAFEEHNPFIYMNFYEMNNDCFLVADYNGNITAFVAGYQMSENEGRIFSLAVKEDYRGIGIGTKLLEAITDIFKKKALRYASLEVRLSNNRAQGLYRKMDFIPCWIEHGYYSDGEDGIIMKKIISPYTKTTVEKVLSKQSRRVKWPALKVNSIF